MIEPIAEIIEAHRSSRRPLDICAAMERMDRMVDHRVRRESIKGIIACLLTMAIAIAIGWFSR